MKEHELVQLAGRLDWDWLDGEIAPLYSNKGRPGIETQQQQPNDEAYDPYFQYFTGPARSSSNTPSRTSAPA